ncbi:helix-turn-helix transcriptional regulator [Nocardioides sp. NPDC023903]|uniref:helix-turn-helix transcriptional regulator n=1 Tax=Nocardioides sp. NPDC023903 TaxID=3157195 RepID=UPI0033CD8ABB
MISTATSPSPSASVGSELRRWRELRSLSQLALATQAEVSTRHVSYVENGRSPADSRDDRPAGRGVARAHGRAEPAAARRRVRPSLSAPGHR